MRRRARMKAKNIRAIFDKFLSEVDLLPFKLFYYSFGLCTVKIILQSFLFSSNVLFYGDIQFFRLVCK